MPLLLEPDGKIVKQQSGKGRDAPQIFQIQKKLKEAGALFAAVPSAGGAGGHPEMQL